MYFCITELRDIKAIRCNRRNIWNAFVATSTVVVCLTTELGLVYRLEVWKWIEHLLCKLLDVACECAVEESRAETLGVGDADVVAVRLRCDVAECGVGDLAAVAELVATVVCKHKRHVVVNYI